MTTNLIMPVYVRTTTPLIQDNNLEQSCKAVVYNVLQLRGVLFSMDRKIEQSNRPVQPCSYHGFLPLRCRALRSPMVRPKYMLQVQQVR